MKTGLKIFCYFLKIFRVFQILILENFIASGENFHDSNIRRTSVRHFNRKNSEKELGFQCKKRWKWRLKRAGQDFSDSLYVCKYEYTERKLFGNFKWYSLLRFSWKLRSWLPNLRPGNFVRVKPRIQNHSVYIEHVVLVLVTFFRHYGSFVVEPSWEYSAVLLVTPLEISCCFFYQ